MASRPAGMACRQPDHWRPEFSFATVQSIDPGFRFFEPTFFVQDDIKVTPKLTVNVGVRYDIPYPRVEARDRYRGFNPTAMNPVVGRPGAIIGVAGEGGVKSKYRGLMKPDYTDVSPRFGFAYQINEKTVVRGGYGLYYAPLLYNEFGRGGLAGYAIQGGANINFGFDANIRFSNYPALPAVDPTIQLQLGLPMSKASTKTSRTDARPNTASTSSVNCRAGWRSRSHT